MHSDGSLQGLAIPRVKNTQLQATLNCSCFCSLHFVVLITNAKPCQNSVYILCGIESRQMPKPGSWISSTYLCAEYTITRKRVFLFPCLKILLGHSNRWTQCDHQEPSCVYGPAERAENLLLFLLYPYLLCGCPPPSPPPPPSCGASEVRNANKRNAAKTLYSVVIRLLAFPAASFILD